MIDHSIALEVMSLASGDSRETTVYISLKLRRGRAFWNKDLGSLLHTIKKLDDDGLADAVDYTKEALQWLVDTGRAGVIDVVAERDNDNRGQCNLAVTVAWTNAAPVTYKTFFQVV